MAISSLLCLTLNTNFFTNTTTFIQPKLCINNYAFHVFVLLTGYWRTPRLHEQVVKDISNGEMLNKKEKHDKTRTINKWSLNNTQMIYNKEKDIGSSLICLLIII